MSKRLEIQAKFDGIHTYGPEKTAQVFEIKDLNVLSVGHRSRFSGKHPNLVIFLAGSFFLASVFGISNSFDQSLQTSKQILGVATTGFELLESGEYNLADQNFESAREEIRQSEEALIRIVNFLPFGQDVDRALEAGSRVSKAIDLLVKGVVLFSGTRLNWDIESNASSQDFFNVLRDSRENLVRSDQELSTAAKLIGEINPTLLPDTEKIRFQEAKAKLDAAQKAVRELVGVQGFLIDLLGGDKKTYALIFQNNNEARATGGFIGTYGLLELGNGQMRIEKIESIYALDGQLTEKIAAPWPLQRQLSPYWGTRDSNWFLDFPASAREFLSFLERTSGVNADGVISMTPDVFEKLLELTGPIYMPAYGETLTAENFRERAQFKTSVDYDRVENQPKKFLADFAPLFLSKIQELDQQKWLDFTSLIFQMIHEKHLVMFSEQPELQEFIESYNADGKIAETRGDYLGIFHSNAGGGKTDLGIEQKVEKKISIDSSGLAIVRLKITRIHNAYEEVFFPKNLDFMRIAVPKQAKLLSATGFDQYEFIKPISENVSNDADVKLWEDSVLWDENTAMYVGVEAGYKIFSNWLMLEPGQTKSVDLVYEIQFDSHTTYTHLLQKQPGARAFDFTMEVNYLAGDVVYFYPPEFRQNENILQINESVNTDRFYGLIGK